MQLIILFIKFAQPGGQIINSENNIVLLILFKTVIEIWDYFLTKLNNKYLHLQICQNDENIFQFGKSGTKNCTID